MYTYNTCCGHSYSPQRFPSHTHTLMVPFSFPNSLASASISSSRYERKHIVQSVCSYYRLDRTWNHQGHTPLDVCVRVFPGCLTELRDPSKCARHHPTGERQETQLNEKEVEWGGGTTGQQHSIFSACRLPHLLQPQLRAALVPGSCHDRLHLQTVSKNNNNKQTKTKTETKQTTTKNLPSCCCLCQIFCCNEKSN